MADHVVTAGRVRHLNTPTATRRLKQLSLGPNTSGPHAGLMTKQHTPRRALAKGRGTAVSAVTRLIAGATHPHLCRLLLRDARATLSQLVDISEQR